MFWSGYFRFAARTGFEHFDDPDVETSNFFWVCYSYGLKCAVDLDDFAFVGDGLSDVDCSNIVKRRLIWISPIFFKELVQPLYVLEQI